MGKSRLPQGCAALKRQLIHHLKDDCIIVDGNKFVEFDAFGTQNAQTLEEEAGFVSPEELLLEKYLYDLYEKRSFWTEKALLGLIDVFTSDFNLFHTFVENKCITLSYLYTKLLKRGSSREAGLATHAIGLLVVAVRSGSNAHEIMEDSIPSLSQALKSWSDSPERLSVLDSLAIITFIGANYPDEMERSMKIMWELIHPKSGSSVELANKPTSALVAAVVVAWSFLLTSLIGRKINPQYWKGSISYLSTLLDNDDRSVRIAAGEAIALIFESGRLDKFSREGNDIASLDHDSSKLRGSAHIESLRGKILSQVRNLSNEASSKGSTKIEISNERSLFRNILAFLETGDCPEISTWTESIQSKFFKRILGRGYNSSHMQDNGLLLDVFSLKPHRKAKPSFKKKDIELLHDIIEFTPKQKHDLLDKENKNKVLASHSAGKKKKTQERDKQRMRAQYWDHDY